MADSTTELTDEMLVSAATAPASVTVGEISQSNRSLSELIALDKYLRQRTLDRRGLRNRIAGMVTHLVTPAPF